MKCTKCGGDFKTYQTKQGFDVDKCKNCGAIWFDKGELNKFLDDERRLEKLGTQGLDNSKATSLNCPRCYHDRMYVGKYPKTNVTLDQCPMCHGLYFDKGELKKIINIDSKSTKKAG
jgi:Zn-finger nucleic acid-binding protein